MLGGLTLLGVMVMISKALAEYGFETVFEAVLNGLREKNVSKAEILRKVESYPISYDLKAKLRDYVSKLYGDEAK